MWANLAVIVSTLGSLAAILAAVLLVLDRIDRGTETAKRSEARRKHVRSRLKSALGHLAALRNHEHALHVVLSLSRSSGDTTKESAAIRELADLRAKFQDLRRDLVQLIDETRSVFQVDDALGRELDELTVSFLPAAVGQPPASEAARERWARAVIERGVESAYDVTLRADRILDALQQQIERA